MKENEIAIITLKEKEKWNNIVKSFSNYDVFIFQNMLKLLKCTEMENQYCFIIMMEKLKQ